MFSNSSQRAQPPSLSRIEVWQIKMNILTQSILHHMICLKLPNITRTRCSASTLPATRCHPLRHRANSSVRLRRVRSLIIEFVSFGWVEALFIYLFIYFPRDTVVKTVKRRTHRDKIWSKGIIKPVSRQFLTVYMQILYRIED